MSDKKSFDVREIGSRLKEVRKKLAKTQGDMSKATGLSPAGISEMEKGFKKPSSVYMFQLRMKYDVNINWILTGEGTMFRPTLELELDFGEDNDVIKDMVLAIKRDKSVRYEILVYFTNIILPKLMKLEEAAAGKKKDAGKLRT